MMDTDRTEHSRFIERCVTKIEKHHDELVDFKTTENCRWFAKEYPQFAITKQI